MKGFKKTVILLTTVMVMFVSIGLTGCKLDEFPDTENDVVLKFWRSGVGDSFISKTIENFQKEYPQYKVYLDSSTNRKDITRDFGESDIDKVDIWMFPVDSLSSTTLKTYAEPFNDILESKYKDENATVYEKYEKSSIDALKWPDGNYYSLSYSGGWYGIVYNESMIGGDTGYTLPRTTEELEYLTIDLYNDNNLTNVAPYIHFVDEGYWKVIYNVWQAQYDGLDYYTNTFYPLGGYVDANATTAEKNNAKTILTKQDGRYKAIEALERILKPQYVVNGSNTKTFTEAQTLFLEGKSVMMANGSWLFNEMRNTDTTGKSFKMMKNPVVSSIIERDDITTIDDDEELRALIDAVDAVTKAEDVPLTGVGYDVSRDDANKIYAARNIMSNNFDAHGIIIPTYSNAKTAAKEFIKYFYSDENLKVYWDTTQLPLPVHYSNGNGPDMTGWDEWSVRQQTFATTATPLYTIQRTASPIFTAGSARPYANINVVSKFTANNAADRQDTAGVWNSIVTYHNSNWNKYVTNAQL